MHGNVSKVTFRRLATVASACHSFRRLSPLHENRKLDPNTLESCLDCACLSFRQAARVVTQLFDESLVAVGLLSTQLPILILLGLHDSLAVTRLANLLVMDAPR
ncbi:MAG: hypothetical protein WDO13_17220 [Verrucomicrobiota bacterium]